MKIPILKDVVWVIDTTLLEGTFTENLPEVCKQLGYEVVTLSGNVSTYELTNLTGKSLNFTPIVAYGCHRFIQKVRGQGWIPGSYPSRIDEVMKLGPLYYMSNIPSDDLLNSEFVFAPISQVIRKPQYFAKMFNTNQLFIKDSLTFKQFGGKVLKEDEIADYLSLYKDVEKIENHNLVLVAPPKKIFSEHRFVIVSKEVISASTYMMEGKLDVRSDVWSVAHLFAQKIAKDFNPCGAWTLDVAMEGETYETSVPKILEINSFSCAGLYACDLQAVVDAVSKRALDDYYLELN